MDTKTIGSQDMPKVQESVLGQTEGKQREALQKRFWEKVDKNGPNGCWMWLASKSPLGYGKFGVGKANRGWYFAHRIAYELIIGAIPQGMELDHLCHNPGCVNPEHLQPVIHRDNILRGNTPMAKHIKKTHCPQGHPYDLLNTYFYHMKGKHMRQCRICRAIRITE